MTTVFCEDRARPEVLIFGGFAAHGWREAPSVGAAHQLNSVVSCGRRIDRAFDRTFAGLAVWPAGEPPDNFDWADDRTIE